MKITLNSADKFGRSSVELATKPGQTVEVIVTDGAVYYNCTVSALELLHAANILFSAGSALTPGPADADFGG